MTSNSIVKLNIGGTIFQTTVTKDDTGAIFIDRDPTHFRLILNFMRDGDVTIPNSKTEIDEIRKEAQYYLLEGLLEKCQIKIPKDTPKKLNFLENYDQVLEVTILSEKPVLIFYYLVDRHGVLSNTVHSLNILDFVEKHQQNFDIYFSE